MLVWLAATAMLAVSATAVSAYTIEPGDTLSMIAARFGTSVSSLADANAIADPDRIVAGRTLAIPGGASGEDPIHHVVRRGETLSSIAAAHGTTVRALAEANGLPEPDRVMTGTRLRIGGPALPSFTPGGPGSHVVQPGETLSGIAARFGTSVSSLADANSIADPDRVIAGRRLTVPGGWRCPVRGDVSFVNDFGYVKPSGRFHEGVDLYAPRGTEAVAPVGGVVEQIHGEIGGLQYRLRGDDGHTYIGTHLDRFGASGHVSAGTVIGYVGSTGNAIGTRPHLHFEIHPAGGGGPVNPYPALVDACR